MSIAEREMTKYDSAEIGFVEGWCKAKGYGPADVMAIGMTFAVVACLKSIGVGTKELPFNKLTLEKYLELYALDKDHKISAWKQEREEREARLRLVA